MKQFIKSSWSEILAFFGALFLFVLTLNPGIFPGDTTEFINAIAVRGVAHPPGYPLILILGRIFSLIPGIGMPASLNLLAAVSGALTVAICARSIRLLTNSAPASIFGAGLLAVSSSFWLYSEVLETFSLNALLISIFLWQCLVFVKTPSPRRALLLIFLLSINAGNHHTAAFLLPVLAAMLYLAAKRFNLGWGFWAKAALISGAGFIPYAYIIFLAHQNPAINWDNAVNLKNLLHLILRKDFGTFLLAPGSLSFTPKTTSLGLYFIDLFKQTFGLMPLLAVAGLSYLYKQKQKTIFSILAYSFISLGPAFMLVSRLQITSIHQKAALERFYIASFVPLAILAGIGFALLAALIPKKFKIVSFACLLLIIPPAIFSFPITNQRGNIFYEMYSRKILENLPENAVFITTGDVSDNGTQYLHLIKKIKPDALIITLPKTVAPWYREQLAARNPELKDLVSEMPQETINRLCARYGAEGRLYISSEVPGLDLSASSCAPLPKGLAVALAPKGNLDLSAYKQEQSAYFESLKNSMLGEAWPADLRTERIKYEISASMDRVGNFLLLNGDKTGAEKFYDMALSASAHWTASLDTLAVLDAEAGDFAGAIERERESIRRNPESPKSFFNLGILLYESGEKEEAKEILLEFLSFRPDPRAQEFEMANRALRELENRK